MGDRLEKAALKYQLTGTLDEVKDGLETLLEEAREIQLHILVGLESPIELRDVLESSNTRMSIGRILVQSSALLQEKDKEEAELIRKIVESVSSLGKILDDMDKASSETPEPPEAEV